MTTASVASRVWRVSLYAAWELGVCLPFSDVRIPSSSNGLKEAQVYTVRPARAAAGGPTDGETGSSSGQGWVAGGRLGVTSLKQGSWKVE